MTMCLDTRLPLHSRHANTTLPSVQVEMSDLDVGPHEVKPRIPILLQQSGSANEAAASPLSVQASKAT